MEGSEETIPFAAIQIGQNYGSVSNEEGVFYINIDNFKQTDSLEFSCLGFKTKSILIKDFNGVVYLEEHVNTLDEVTLGGKKLTALEIIANVNKNLKDNYVSQHNTKQKIFYRTKSNQRIIDNRFFIKKTRNIDKKLIARFNKYNDSIREQTKNWRSTTYKDALLNCSLDKKNKLKIEVEKATMLINKGNDNSGEAVRKKLYTFIKKIVKNKSYKIKWGLKKVADSEQLIKDKKETEKTRKMNTMKWKLENLVDDFFFTDSWFLSKILDEDNYNYTLADITYFDDKLVYLLEFSPKKSSSKFKGKLYIDEEDFAVIKFDFNMLKNKNVINVNLKMIGMKTRTYNRNGSMIFTKTKTGKYAPKYIKDANDSYQYVDITLTFKETSEEKNKLKFKINMLNESEIKTTNEYLFLDANSLSESQYSTVVEESVYKLELLKKYDNTLWQKYNIIAPTQSIVNYDAGE